MEAWERRAVTGDFLGIPAKLSWKRSGTLAHFIDGYAIAGGQKRLIEAVKAKREEFAQTGAISGTALELWLCLFAEWRADRWTGGYPKSRQETKRLNALSTALAACLRAATQEEAQALVPLFNGLTAKSD
jgi:hypothetical protein